MSAVLGTEITVGTSNTIDADPVVTVLDNASYFFAWNDDSNIRGRYYTPGATPVGADFLVNILTATAGTQSHVSVTPISAGGTLDRGVYVTWQSTVSDDVLGVYIDENGVVGTPSIINASTSGVQIEPSVAVQSDDDVFVVWQTDNGANIRGIFDGGAEFTVNSETSGNQSDPTVVRLTDDRFLVTWTNDSTGNEDIKAQMFNTDGSVFAGEFNINQANNDDQASAKVTALAGGGFFVVWQTGTGTDNRDIRGAFFDSTRARLSETTLNTTTALDQLDPAVTVLGDGRVFVAWTSSTSATESEIRGRIIGANGTPEGDDFLISTDLAVDKNHDVSVATLGPDRVIVTWVSDSGTNGQIQSNTIKFENTRPEGADKTITMSEDGNRSFTAADFGFTDQDSADSLVSIRITALPAKGALTLNGTPVTFAQDVLVADLGDLVYTPAADDNGAAYATFKFQVFDGKNLSAVANTITFDVTAVNDAPVITAPATYSAPGEPIQLTGLSITDVDAGAGQITVTLSVPPLPLGGTLDATDDDGGGNLDGVTVVRSGAGNQLTLTGTLADINAFLAASGTNGLKFTPISLFGTVNLTIQVNDGGNTGGPALSDTTVVPITIVNQPPKVTIGAIAAIAEDAAPVALTTITVSDSSTNMDTAGSTLTLSVAPGSGVLTAAGSGGVSVSGSGTGVITLAGTFTAINAFIAGSHLFFDSTADFNGSVAIQGVANDSVVDGNSTSSTINVTPDPDIVADKVTFAEDTPAPLAAHVFNVITGVGTDAPSTADNFENPGRQLTHINGITVSNGQVIDLGSATLTVSSNGQISLVPDEDYNGTINFTYSVTSGGAIETAGVTVKITPVNDAPKNLAISKSTVAEFSPNGTVVGLVSATDAESPAALTYTLLNDADGRFQLVGKELRVADGIRLDYEQTRSYSVVLRVQDPEGLSQTKTFVISLDDVNPETVVADNRDNRVFGGALDDTISGLGGKDYLSGNAGDDRLLGGTGDDTLIGGAGNDHLDGGAGADSMDGGAGADTYIVDALADRVIETGSGGDDTVISSVSLTLMANVETLMLSGAGNLTGTGNTLANMLVGNTGNNLLDGGLGDDRMYGGAGNDTYVVSQAGDRVYEISGAAGGIDLVRSSVSFTLGQFVENLTLTGATDLNGIGNELANVITGNSGKNILSGGAGSDTILGMSGDDKLYGGDGNDTLDGGAGNDSLVGNQGNDTLIGGVGNDYIVGGDGNDVLVGGVGRDTLIGGAGSDTFRFDAAPSAANVDLVLDFTAGDRFELSSAAMAGLGAAGPLSAALFRANDAGVAGDANDRILYSTDTGKLIYDADGNGSGAGIVIAQLDANLNLRASDFVVI